MGNRNMILPYKLEKFTARNDYAFKKLFGTDENKDIMIEFVALVTKIDKVKFKDVRIENSELHPKFFDDKAGRLDIKILLQDGQKIDVEMQNIYFDYYAKRSIFYWTELLTENFKHGADYAELIDDIFEIHFFDLTKLKEKNMTELEKWLLFIKTEDNEVRTQLAQENPVMAKANEVMNSFYLDDQERELYMAAGRYESDRISMIHESERKGLERGIRQGVRRQAVETAKKLLKIGLSAENIAEATGLSLQEINGLTSAAL